MMVTVEEKSVELALVKAARLLQVMQEDLQYRVIEEHRGFLGFFGRKVSIQAWKREDRFSSSTPMNPLAPLSEESRDRILLVSEQLFEKMFGTKPNIIWEYRNEELRIDFQDHNLADQLMKNSRLAEALEIIIKRMESIRQEQRFSFRLSVDSQGVRQKKEDDLIREAKRLSDKVYTQKRPITLNYKNSYDRKIIHLALHKDARVYTKSIGNGHHRKLMILPADGLEKHANSDPRDLV